MLPVMSVRIVITVECTYNPKYISINIVNRFKNYRIIDKTKVIFFQHGTYKNGCSYLIVGSVLIFSS